MSLDLFKAFQVSKIKAYFDGDPMPYLATLTLPAFSAPTETFNSTSTGGEIVVADGFRRMPTGNAEFVFEADSQQVSKIIYDATKIVSVNAIMCQNNMQPQLGQFVPLPVSYKLACQFFEVEPGEIAMGAKREITARANVFSFKLEYNLISVVDFDFVNGTFSIDSQDLLATVSNLIG